MTDLLATLAPSCVCWDPTPSTAASERDAQAIAILKRMADFLSQAQHFSVTAEIGLMWSRPLGKSSSSAKPVSSSSGVPIVCESISPSAMGAQAASASTARRLRCSIREQVYATAAKPGTLDEAIAYFINDLDMRFPGRTFPHGWPSR